MRTGTLRAHEDFQVYDIDVFSNGNFIAAGFLSRVLFKVFLQYYLCSSGCVWYSAVKKLINEVYNSINLCSFSVFASSLTLPQLHVKRQFTDSL